MKTVFNYAAKRVEAGRRRHDTQKLNIQVLGECIRYEWLFFIARRYASAIYVIALCLYAYLSQVGVLHHG